MSNKNKRIVNSKDSDGNKKTVAVVKPTAKDTREGQKVYNKIFREALESGALLRQKLGTYMEEQGLWSEGKQKEYDDLLKDVLDSEKKLKAGGIKLSEAKEIAFEMADNRGSLRDLIAEKTMMDTNTAEGQGDNARFNYLMAACVVDMNTGKPIFVDKYGDVSVEVYENSADQEYIVEAASQLAEMMYGLDASYEQSLPENKFLSKFDFVDKELRLVNKDGVLVDREGRLVNEEGRFVNEEGDFVDKEGVRIDEEGEYLIDEQPFLDDDGEEIILKEKEKKKKSPKKTAKDKKTTETSA